MPFLDDLVVDSLTIRGVRAGDNVTLSGLSDLAAAVGGGGGGGGISGTDPPRLLAGATSPTSCVTGSTTAVSLDTTIGVSGTSATLGEGGTIVIGDAGVYHFDVIGTWDPGIGACSLTMGGTVTGGDPLNPGLDFTGPPAAPSTDSGASPSTLSETLYLPAGATFTVTALQNSGSTVNLTVVIVRVTRLV